VADCAERREKIVRKVGREERRRKEGRKEGRNRKKQGRMRERERVVFVSWGWFRMSLLLLSELSLLSSLFSLSIVLV